LVQNVRWHHRHVPTLPKHLPKISTVRLSRDVVQVAPLLRRLYVCHIYIGGRTGMRSNRASRARVALCSCLIGVGWEIASSLDPATEDLSANEVRATVKRRDGAFWVATTKTNDRFDRRTGKLRQRFRFSEDRPQTTLFARAIGLGEELGVEVLPSV
jgi:hypothetical protein